MPHIEPLLLTKFAIRGILFHGENENFFKEPQNAYSAVPSIPEEGLEPRGGRGEGRRIPPCRSSSC